MQREAKNAAEGGKTGSHDIHGDLAEHRPVAGRPDMRVFYGFDALPHFVRPTVTVGSYDGVHSGHLALLRTVAGRARAQGGESVVLTFEPHPRVTLGRADGLRLLTSLEEKIYLLGQQGIDNLIVIPFDKAFSALAPDTFIRDYLVGRIGAETLVVGFNHRFGRDKQGSYDYLGSHGFGLEVVEVGECDVDAEKVSSTVIRRLVAQGDMARAARLLSHPYLVIGTAAAGRIRTDDPLKLLPPAGSYQVRIGGRPARLTVDTSQNLIIRDGCPDGRAVPNLLSTMLSYDCQIRVWYKHTDQMAICHHSNYICYYEAARSELLRYLGMSFAEVEKRGIMMPILEVQSKYHRPAYYDELLTVRIMLRELPTARINFFYEIYNEKGELLNTGMTQLGFIHSDTRRPCRVPDWFLKLVADKWTEE